MNRTVKILTVAALGVAAFGASCAMGSVAHAAGVPVTQLVDHLLAVFYGNPAARWRLLHFYRWQQPGMPADWYGGYVRSLIIHYPHAMARCLAQLTHHVHATACP